MKLPPKKANMFNIDDYFSVKINLVDNTSPLHPNMPFGKIISVKVTIM